MADHQMTRRGGAQPPAGATRAAWLAAVVLIGLNLRPFLTGIGPLATSIRSSTGLDYRGMAWLTLLPLLLMGAAAFLAPAVLRALGARRTVLGSLVLLGLGSALRGVAPGGVTLIATAALCGLGVAFIQAAFPGLIKRHFRDHVAPVTGLYSATLMGGGALGAQITPLLSAWSGSWHQALAWWSVPVVLALLLAWYVLPRHEAGVRTAAPSTELLRRPRTWLLMISFGLVNGGYASLIAWLAPFYQMRGWSSPASGSLVAWMSIAQASAALLLPVLAARQRDRRPWLWLTLLLQAMGYAAFAFWPDLAPRSFAVISGIGLGGFFAITLVVALDHLPDPERAGTLSALMQGGGFLIAATAPWITARLYDLDGGFGAGWIMHLACVTLVFGLTVRLAPDRYAAAMAARAPTAARRTR